MCRIHRARAISGPLEVGVTPFLPDGKSPLTSVAFVCSSHIKRAVPPAKKVGAPLSLRLAAALGHIAGHFVPNKVVGEEFPHQPLDLPHQLLTQFSCPTNVLLFKEWMVDLCGSGKGNVIGHVRLLVSTLLKPTTYDLR